MCLQRLTMPGPLRLISGFCGPVQLHWRCLGTSCCSLTAALRDRSLERLPVTRLQPPRTEPAYLEPRSLPQPDHPLLDLVLEGRDFVPLEHYARWVHRAARRCGLEVSLGWAAPCQRHLVTRLQPGSSDVAAQYQLQLYKRCVQLRRVAAWRVGLLLHALLPAAPPGVRVRLEEHTAAADEERYIPDMQLRELQQEVELVGTENYHKYKRSATVEFWLNIAHGTRNRHKKKTETDD